MSLGFNADGKRMLVSVSVPNTPGAPTFGNKPKGGAGLAFIDRKLWVTDIDGDFIGGKRELPDCCTAVIRAD